jgi:hypothetical protein
VNINWSKEMARIQGFLSKHKPQLLEAKQANATKPNLVERKLSLSLSHFCCSFD